MPARTRRRRCDRDHCGVQTARHVRAGGRALLVDIELDRLSPAIATIARQEFRDKGEDAIRGTGYVVACPDAALWSFATTDSFEAAVLRAENLGDDADTTAAVCGQIAGAFYGEQGIPQRWLKRLHQAGEIRSMADALGQAAVRAAADRSVFNATAVPVLDNPATG